MRTETMIAFRNLVQAKRRTRLVAIAIALVAMLFLILRVIAGSVSERMIEAATTLSAGHVNVGGFFKSRKKSSEPIIATGKELKELVKQMVPDATHIIDRHRGWGRFIGPKSSINSGINGIRYEEETRFFNSIRLAKESEYKKDGREEVFGKIEDLQKENHILLFAGQAKKLGAVVGDRITVVIEAAGGRTNTLDLTVGVIASDIGFLSNWNIFVPHKTILSLYGLSEDTTGVIMVYLKNPSHATKVMEELRTKLADKGYQTMDHDPNPFFMKFDKVMGEDWLGQKLDLTIWSDEISFINWVTSALDIITLFVISVLSVIIIGGVLNSMWMAVRERTKEIGTMRAIGTQRNFILRLFVFEAAMLGFFSASLGILLATSFISIINSLHIPITNSGIRLFLMSNFIQFNLHIDQIISTIMFFILVTSFGALYPAFTASRLHPVKALAHTK